MRWIVFLVVGVLAVPAGACTDQTPCQIGSRSYHVKEPDNWDGVSPLPVMLHFHGWGRQGTLTVKHSRISGATRTRGVLLLGPNGLGGSWAFWSPGSSDTEFAAEVIEDAAKRYPIDRSKIIISGYSFGSAMAWRYACENGSDVAAVLAIGGTLNQQEFCETQPKEVRHVHGLKDTVMDYPFGPDGDTSYPVALWRNLFDCGQDYSESAWDAPRDSFTRRVWNCESGQVVLDIHNRGHFIPVGWIAAQLDEILDLQN